MSYSAAFESLLVFVFECSFKSPQLLEHISEICRLNRSLVLDSVIHEYCLSQLLSSFGWYLEQDHFKVKMYSVRENLLASGLHEFTLSAKTLNKRELMS